jgi:hypothetical protein
MCACVGNQWSHGVVIARFRSFYSEPSSSMSRSPSINLPLPLVRLGLNLLLVPEELGGQQASQILTLPLNEASPDAYSTY